MRVMAGASAASYAWPPCVYSPPKTVLSEAHSACTSAALSLPEP
jgi:hypothetical protein